MAMAACFVAGPAGMLIPAWSGSLAWLTQGIIAFMLRVINAFSSLSFAGSLIYIDVWSLIITYLVVLLVTMALLRNKKSPLLMDSLQPNLMA